MTRHAPILVLVTALTACGDETKSGDTAGDATGDASEVGNGPCEAGELLCDEACIDPTYDLDHCGRCDNPCGEDSICDTNVCVCKAGFDDCGAGAEVVCVDTDTSDDHCGACGEPCDVGYRCDGQGECVRDCDEGETACGNVCVDTAIDDLHCGACDNACGSQGNCIGSTCYCDGDLVVDAMSPAVHALTAPRDGPIVVTMSCHVATDDAPGALYVYGNRSGKVSGTVEVDRTRVTFTPDEALHVGEHVMVTLPEGRLDAAPEGTNAGWVGAFEVGATAGFGSFEAGPTLPCASAFTSTADDYQCRRVTPADVDDDGDLDLLAQLWWGEGSHLRVALGDGDGALVPRDVAMAGAVDGGPHAIADLDGDGIVDDILAAGLLWSDTGDLTFPEKQAELGSGYGEPALVGDLDRDGDVDVVFVHTTVSIWMNDGAGTLTEHDHSFASSSGLPACGRLGDVDEDGDLDYLDGSVWLNDGLGYFTKSQVSVGGQASCQLRDFDGDGHLDWFTNGQTFYFGLGDGTFIEEALDAPIPGAWYEMTEAFDRDGDGDLDLFATGGKTLTNEGNGSFTAGPDLDLGDTFSFGDFDGDGALDAVGRDQEQIRVWLNRAPAEP